MICFINVLHNITKQESLILVKCEGSGLCSAPTSESQALCACTVGAWGWRKFKAAASYHSRTGTSASLDLQKNTSGKRKASCAFPFPSCTNTRAWRIRTCCGCLSWDALTLQHMRDFQALIDLESTGDTITEAIWKLSQTPVSASCQ